MYDITDLVAMLWLGRAFNTSPQSLLTDGKLAQALVLTAARRGPFGMLHALPWSWATPIYRVHVRWALSRRQLETVPQRLLTCGSPRPLHEHQG